MTARDGIVVDRAHKTIDGVPVLVDASLHAPAGRVTALLGPNGAGKSTLLRALAGLVRLDAGTVRINGAALADHARPTAIGFLLDPDALHPGRTARGHLGVVAAAAGRPRQRITDTLAVVGMAAHETVRIGEMSLGMRQRLALAAALLDDPVALVLDEPHNGLDAEAIGWLREVLRLFADAGRTVLISSHLLGEVQLMADDIAVVHDGTVVAAGPLTTLVGHQRDPQQLENWYFEQIRQPR